MVHWQGLFAQPANVRSFSMLELRCASRMAYRFFKSLSQPMFCRALGFTRDQTPSCCSGGHFEDVTLDPDGWPGGRTVNVALARPNDSWSRLPGSLLNICTRAALPERMRKARRIAVTRLVGCWMMDGCSPGRTPCACCGRLARCLLVLGLAKAAL